MSEDDPNDKELERLRLAAAQGSTSARRDPDRQMLQELADELSDWSERLEHEGVSSPDARFALREVLLRAEFELLEARANIPGPDDPEHAHVD